MQGKWVTIAQFAVPETVVRVNLSEISQVEYWAREFGCTPFELRVAVRAVGVTVANVRAYLKSRGWHKLECDDTVGFASPIPSPRGAWPSDQSQAAIGPVRGRSAP